MNWNIKSHMIETKNYTKAVKDSFQLSRVGRVISLHSQKMSISMTYPILETWFYDEPQKLQTIYCRFKFLNHPRMSFVVEIYAHSIFRKLLNPSKHFLTPKTNSKFRHLSRWPTIKFFLVCLLRATWFSICAMVP